MLLTIEIVFLLLAFSYFFLIAFFLAGWVKEKEYEPHAKPFSTFASIIVAARNEEANITHLLTDISAQDYPKDLFEIIVADDDSEDDTANSVLQFKVPGLNLKMVKNEKGRFGKKNALLKAIGQSKGDLLVTTDADCRIGKSWLSTIVSFYEEKKPEMIIAPVCLHKGTSFLGKIQELEFLSLSGITGGSALAGTPLLCNGANLAYKKSAFLGVNGFEGNEQTPSGDDVLLMLKIKKAFPGGIRYLKSRNASVFTEGPKTVSQFINQRKRWISKNRFFNDRFISVSAWLILLFCFSILCSAALSFINTGFAEILAVSLSVKFFIDFLFLFLTASFFNRKSRLWLYLPVQIVYIFYVPLFSLTCLTGNFSWKGRLYN